MLPEGVRAGGRVLQALEPMEGNWSEEAAAALGALFSLHCVMRACCMRCMVTYNFSGSVCRDLCPSADEIIEDTGRLICLCVCVSICLPLSVF